MHRTVFSCFVLLVFCLCNVSAHDECYYDKKLILRTPNVAECSSYCLSYATDKGTCSVWEFNAKEEKCFGYLFSDDGSYRNRYTYCALIPGAAIKNFAAYNGLNQTAIGCKIKPVALGIQANKETCATTCASLVSNIYGGCGGWLYDEESNNCSGMLTVEDESLQCGIPGA